MLEGQISMWTIRLRNVGNAPASGLFLKTNLPWIDIVDNEISSSEKCMTIEEKESRAISRCLGPSGTLMSIPVKGNIDPNQTFDIQVRVRTSGEKKQDFYMLYKYDIVTNLAEKDSKRRSRWLRKMYEGSQVQVFWTVATCSSFSSLLQRHKCAASKLWPCSG